MTINRSNATNAYYDKQNQIPGELVKNSSELPI